MIIKINENISIWQEFNPIKLSLEQSRLNTLDSKKMLALLGFEKKRISIKNRWFDIIRPSELARKRNKKDGYYRVIYIQINMDTGEYYIGKVNRPKWSEIQRYEGSGLKFKNKYKKSKNAFVRYFIAVCETAEETEELEASIVNKELLADEKCLNLVAGGGGTSNHPSLAETSEKKREYMRNNPEQSLPMILASKKAFQSGDTPTLRARNKRIKEVMSTENHRDLSRERFLKWKKEKPEEYAEARRKSHEKIKTPEVQTKRQESFKQWAKQNPEKYKAWQEKLVSSRTSKKANEKRKASINEWYKKNPLVAKSNAQKRAKAAAAKRSKPVSMIDLESGKVLQNFPSGHDAARWLAQEGKAKSIKCSSPINAVCHRKPSSTGHGYRKKAHGYGWRFTEKEAPP